VAAVCLLEALDDGAAARTSPSAAALATAGVGAVAASVLAVLMETRAKATLPAVV
jgi:hypothetical protein